MANILTCAICLDAVQDATICRFCKNFFCKTEVRAWIETHETCPMCRHPDMDPATDLLHLPWMADVTTAFQESTEKLSQKSTEITNQRAELAELQEQLTTKNNLLIRLERKLAKTKRRHCTEMASVIMAKQDEMDKNGQLFETNQKLEKRLHTLEQALTTIKGAFETTNPRKRRRTEADPQE